MLVSMLPFAAFAEDGQTAAAQTEEPAKTEDTPKVEEKTGDTPKADGKTDAAKTDEKSGDTAKDTVKDESKDTVKDENKDTPTGDTEQPAKGGTEDTAQAETLQEQAEPKPLANPSATLRYNANGGTGAEYISERAGANDAAEVFFKAEKIERFTAPENKEFGSWNTSTDGSGKTYNVGDLVIVRGGESLTLYAQWVDAAPKTVDITLTYDANGGTGSCSETKTFNVGEEYTFTVKSRSDTGIDRAKHAFRYWTDDRDGEGARYSGNNQITVTGDTTLYAQWQYVPQKISVVYYPNTDLGVPEVDRGITEGTSYTVKGSNTFNPPRGKHFVNWNTASDGSGTTYEAGQQITAPGENLILVAQWADNPKWSNLGIAISAPPTALPEADITYTIKVTNKTGYDLNSVAVEVALPEEVTYNSQSSSGAWSLSYNSATRTVTAKLESDDGSAVLAENGISEFTLPVKIKKMAFKTIEATAKIAGASSPTGGKTGESSSAAAQTTMMATEIHVITEQAEQPLGKEITYIVEITNQYGFTMNSIEVNNVMSSSDCITGLQLSSDSLKNGWSLKSTGNGSLLCKFTGELVSGATTVFKLTTTFDKDGGTPASRAAACTATITSLTDENGITVSGSFGSASRTVTLKELDWSNLKIEKKVDKTTAGLGNTLNYEIKVTNNTGYDLSYLCVEDPTPAGTSYPTGSQVSGNWFLSIPSDNSKVVAELRGGLANGASDTFTMEVGVDRDVPSGKVESTATITSAKSGSYYDLTKDHPDGLPSNTVTTEIDPMFNLDIEVRALQPAAGVGEDHKFTYEVTVKNNGFRLATAKIENVFPEGVGTIVGTPDQNCGFSSDYSTVDINSLPKGETVSYTITTNFVPGGAATAVLEAKIISVTTQTENTYTGSKSAKATVYSLAGLTIEKTVDKSEAKPGDTLTYTITVKNETGIAMRKVGVEDRLPIDKVEVDPIDLPNVVDYYPDTGLVYFDISDLAAGGEYSVEIKVTVKSGMIDTVVNTAAIVLATLDNGNEVDGKDLADKKDDATTDIDSGLTISVTPSAPFANMYGQFSYTVTVTNNTGVTLKEVYVTDNLPTDVPPLSAHKDENVRLSFDAQSIVWAKTVYAKISNLENGKEASFDVTVQFRYSSTTTAVNRAVITSAVTADGLTMSDGLPSAEATVCLSSGLTINKSVNKDTAKPGDTLIYTVEVNNGTAVGLTKLCVDDILPAGVTYDPDNSVPGDWTFDTATTPGTVKATLSNGLASGGKAAFKIAATVNAGTSGTVTNTAKITEAANAYGSGSVDKSATAQTEVLAKVPVNVTVLFAGLKDVSQVPAGYKLTGADANAFLKGEIKLDPAESKTGHVFRKFSTEEYVRLGQEYSLSFTQSDYDIPGYICTLTTETDPIKVTAQDASAGINVEITLSYVKENLYTYPSVTVRTYFKGLAKLPDSFGYKLTCTSAPEEAIAFQGPLTLTPGTENGVPYLEFSAKNVTLQTGTELTFSFTQSGYDVPGYLCALGSSTFKFTLPAPTTDVRQPILLKIENTYTQPDWSKLTVTKTADKTSATPGSVVKYTVTVTNNTGVDLSNITVADTLDSRLRYSDSTGDYDTGTGTWTVASLANGKSVTLTLTAKLKYALAAGTVIENTASVTEAAAAGLIYDLSGQKLNDSVSVTVTSGKGSPRTGDDSNLGLWIAVMAASLACAGAAVIIYKKRRG